MFPDLRICEVPLSELQEVDPQLATLFNINTQNDLTVALKFAKETGRSKPVASSDLSDRAGERHRHEEDLPSDIKRGLVRVMTSVETGRQMPVETPITIMLNEEEIATTQATPKDLDDLALGFLVGEGLLADRRALRGVDVDSKRGLVYVMTTEQVPDDLATRTRYITSGCGKGLTFSSVRHARGLQTIDSDLLLTSNELYRWMAELAERSADYKDRGGYHSCGLVVGGELVVVREDIGRHNAVDKVLGQAWCADIDLTQSVLLSSGRISYEMIVKAAKNRVPVVASRSAATNLATGVAEELGITLAGYIRGGKVVVYSHPERISQTEEDT
jgi:FdhD protein